jgi:YD repeat-containing protein
MGNQVTYQYNWDHQLVQFSSPDSNEVCSWTYDGLGRLAASDNRQNGIHVKQQYVYAMGQIYGVVEQGRGLDRYIMIPGTRRGVAVIKHDGTVLYPLWDHAGSIDCLLNRQGTKTGSRRFRSIGAPKEEETMPIAIGYCGGLAFVGHTLLFVDGQAWYMAFHRAAAASAPWPNQPSLREKSPFIAPAFEVTK